MARRKVVSKLDRRNSFPSSPAPPSHTAPLCAPPTRPDWPVVCPGLNSTNLPHILVFRTCRIKGPDIPRAGRFGAPVEAARQGWAKSSANKIPSHALHDKDLQRQTGVGTLLSSHEQRALLVPVISHISTAVQPQVSFLHRFI